MLPLCPSAVLLLLSLSTAAMMIYAGETRALDRKLPLSQPHMVEQIPDPHWHDNACLACHDGSPPGRANLRQRESAPLCNNCHNSVSAGDHLHVSDIAPDADMLKRMPADYRSALQRGQVSCTTCHDLLAQCLPERRGEKAENPMFVRGAPFAYRSAPCYLCHDAGAYQRLNPHKQIDKEGKIRQATCKLCHAKTESLRRDSKPESISFNIKRDLSDMCTGCHPWLPHPGGRFMFGSTFKDRKRPEHLTTPPPDMRKRMQRMAQRNGIILPLDSSNGKIFCATCHNPHAPGVLTDSAAASGANADKRLRMESLCINCHDK